MEKSTPASQEFQRVLDAKLVLAVLATGIMSFCGVVVETAMNVAFPSLMEEFSVDTATVQWMTTGYLVVLAIVIPTSAYLKQTFKTKNLFLGALTMFVVGILVCAFAPSFSVLLLGRIIQGVGTGIALPLMFNIIIDQTPYENMGMMMGLGTLVTALAPAVGPSLGGVIIESWGWRAVFISLLPILLASFIMGATSIRQSAILTKSKFDLTGFGLLAVFVVTIIVALSEGSAHMALTAKVLINLAAAIVSGAMFVKHAMSADNPLIDLSVFDNRTYKLAIVVLILLQAVILALGYLMPNYAQLVVGAGPAKSGSVMLPGCLLGAFLAPVSGRILDRFGAKKPLVIGNICCVVSMLLMYTNGFSLTIGMLTGFYAIMTLGSGLTMGNTMTYSLEGLDDSLKAAGNATINTSQQLAGAIGTALVTGIVNASQSVGTGSLAQTTCVGCVSSFAFLLFFAACMLACTLLIFRKQN